MLILSDDDIERRLTAADAVRWMGEAVDAQHRGDLLSPPRVHADLGAGRLVFTAGRVAGEWFGYRSYDTLPGEAGSQVVVVHDDATGEVRAVAVGNALGPRRTGAIGAVAVDALAAPAADVVAVIGSGTQAWFQLWALAAVRRPHEVRIHSRDEQRRSDFARRLGSLTEAGCRPMTHPRDAVEGADVVILATDSPVPVIEASWLGPTTYVTTLGPKQQGRAEFGPDLPAAATLLVTDSPAQIDAYDPPNVLTGTADNGRLVSLGAVRAGEVDMPPDGGIRVFFSVGLAGTEAYLLHRLASRA